MISALAIPFKVGGYGAINFGGITDKILTEIKVIISAATNTALAYKAHQYCKDSVNAQSAIKVFKAQNNKL